MTEASDAIKSSRRSCSLPSRVVEDVLHHTSLTYHIQYLMLQIIDRSSVAPTTMNVIVHLLICVPALLVMVSASHLRSIHHEVLDLRHPHSVAMSYLSSSELSKVYQRFLIRYEVI